MNNEISEKLQDARNTLFQVQNNLDIVTSNQQYKATSTKINRQNITESISDLENVISSLNEIYEQLRNQKK